MSKVPTTERSKESGEGNEDEDEEPVPSPVISDTGPSGAEGSGAGTETGGAKQHSSTGGPEPGTKQRTSTGGAESGAEHQTSTGGAESGAKQRSSTGGAESGAEHRSSTGGAEAGAKQRTSTGGGESGAEGPAPSGGSAESEAEGQGQAPSTQETTTFEPDDSIEGEGKKHYMSEESSSVERKRSIEIIEEIGEFDDAPVSFPLPPGYEASAEAESEFEDMLKDEEEGEQPEDLEYNLGLSISQTDEFEGEDVFYGNYHKLLPMLDTDEDANEEAFLKRYAEEYGEDDEDVPTKPPEVLSVHSLNEMIRLLNKEDDDECEPLEDSNEDIPETDVPGTVGMIEEENMVVLGPSHPKMQRFQDALKKHLLKQIYITECEERDLGSEVRNRRKEREELGTQLYNLQYELSRQTDFFDKQERDLDAMTEKRLAVEKAAEEMRIVYLKLQHEVKIEIEEERAIMQMVKEMDMMEWCVRRAAREYDGDLLVSHKIDEQYQKLKTSTEIEKRDQDFYLDRIMTRVQTMEQANDGIQRQINAHLDEQKELNNFISEAGTEIEALQMEKVHLQRAWNETIAVVRARDDALTAARDTLATSKEECRIKESDLRSLMRSITKEQEKHEELTILVKRRKMEERHLRSQLTTLTGNCAELEATLQTLQNIRAQIEKQFFRAESEMISYEKEIDAPRRRIESLNIEKAKLEDEILFAIQEQTSVDKTAHGIARKIQHSRDRTRNVEGDIAKVENDLTSVTCVCEKLRTELLKKTTTLEELEKKLITQEKILQAQASDMKYSDKQIQKKSSEIELLTRKFNKLVEDHGGVETGPLEKEIDELERQISAHRAICVELQEKWLKLQDDLVILTTKRDEILAENDLIRKEAFIMDRKRQRVEAENDIKRAEIQDLTKAIDVLRNEVQMMNSKLYAGREEQEQMDKENILIQNELVYLLKDAEMEAYDLQDEITSLESEKDKLTNGLAEAHEQCLLWEKKVKLARELKDTIKKEQESSTSGLKLAIHHMQVRFNELKRAQEKIMTDLEGCVDKRERIIQEADLNIKTSNIHPKKIKLNIQRDEANLQEKNKQLIKEAMEAEAEVKTMEARVATLEARIQCETESLRSIKSMIEEADKKINEAAIEKHKNLIEILLRQMKYKVLEAVNLNRFNFPGDEESLLEELSEMEKKCYAIVELCDTLLKEFPECELPIKLVKASILPNVH